MIYLANEIVQQSKVRNKPEFLSSFAPFIADATESAYRGSPPNIQDKIRRVVQVWRERKIFTEEVQAEVEGKMDGGFVFYTWMEINLTECLAADKKGMMTGKSMLGGGGLLGARTGGGLLGVGSSSGGGSIPLELIPLAKTIKDLSDKNTSITIAIGTANTEYAKHFDAESLPAPPVYAARLSSLMKTLDTADTAIKGAIEARKAHIRNIERLLEQSKTALERDQKTAADIAAKKQRTAETKDQVETMILQDIDKTNNGGDDVDAGTDIIRAASAGRSRTPDTRSPEIEALTPPSQIHSEADPPTPASELHHRHSIAAGIPPNAVPEGYHAGASELLASLTGSLHGAIHRGNGNGGLKRPGEGENENVFEGLDEDLVNMLKNEGGHEQKRVKTDNGMPQQQEEDDDEYRP